MECSIIHCTVPTFPMVMVVEVRLCLFEMFMNSTNKLCFFLLSVHIYNAFYVSVRSFATSDEQFYSVIEMGLRSGVGALYHVDKLMIKVKHKWSRNNGVTSLAS